MSQQTDLVVKARAVMPREGFTLPADYYVDVSYFNREMEGFSAGCGSRPGAPSSSNGRGNSSCAMSSATSLIVTRNPIRARVAPSTMCADIGARASAPSLRGYLAGSIQCPYHAWTYDLDGRLIGAPHMDEVPHFRQEDYPLHAGSRGRLGRPHLSEPVAGSLTACRTAGGPAGEVQPLAHGASRLGHRIVYDVKANWKLLIQNYSECLHCPNLHPALNKLSHYLSGENEPLRATYMGGRMDLRPGVATLSMDGTCPRAFLPGLSQDDVRRVYYYAIFPNMLLSLHPDYMLTHTLWPIGPDRTVNSASGTSIRPSSTRPASARRTRSSSGT